MKFYYYCMSSQEKIRMVELSNMCAGKQQNTELNKLKAEEVELYEITECPMSNDVADVFISDRFRALHKDGTVFNLEGTPEKGIPSIKYAEHLTLTNYSWYRGKDGKLYDHHAKEQPEDMLLKSAAIGSSKNYSVGIRRDGKTLQLVTATGEPYKIPLARLKDMDPNFLGRDGRVTSWVRANSDWKNDMVEAKSKKVFFGSDGTCLIEWNGLIYSVMPAENQYMRGMPSVILDAAYRDGDYIDDIEVLVADKIYINHKGKLVFVEGWNEGIANTRKYNDAIVKAQKWENLVQCEVLDGHLVGKTKDGRILTTFEPEICGNLKNIDHAFVCKNYALFLVK